jgi:mitochondrial division protein 1
MADVRAFSKDTTVSSRNAMANIVASVRCLQIEDSIIATGSTDATVRIWDLTRAETYSSPTQPAISVISSLIHTRGDEDSDSEATDGSHLSRPHTPQQYISTADCCVDVFDSHVGEITALHFMGGTLVSGSADKTIRVWDLNSGKCVQTIDVLTVIAQTTNPQLASWGTGRRAGTDWRSASFNSFAKGAKDATESCFIGGLQCFENALATGTSDGIIRLWDCICPPLWFLWANDSALRTGSSDVGWTYRPCNVPSVR